MTQKALCVAINDYEGEANDLPSCVNDLEAFRDLLERDFGFDEVRTLTDEDAEIQAVKDDLEWLFEGATSRDRLVFFYSGHGYQQVVDGVLQEMLVLHDGFFEDNELSSIIQESRARPGTTTVVLDSCFSGGMEKVLYPNHEELEVARTKVWTPTQDQQEEAAKALTQSFGNGRVKQFAGFLEAPTGKAGAASKSFKSASDETGEVQMTGLLLSACLEDETAAASTSRTYGMSAFTYALTEVLGELGTDISSLELHRAVTEKLRNEGFRQTPMLKEPTRPAGLSRRTFITFEDEKAAVGKGFAVGAAGVGQQQPDPKFLGALAGVVLPILVEEVIEYATKGTMPDQQKALDKAWYDSVLDAAIDYAREHGPEIAEAAVDYFSKEGVPTKGGFGQKELPDPKWLSSLVSTTLPIIIDEVIDYATKGAAPGQQKGADGFAQQQPDPKFLGAVISAVAPVLIEQAVDYFSKGAAPGQQKGADGFAQQQPDPKFLGAVISVVAPVLIEQAVDYFSKGAMPGQQSKSIVAGAYPWERPWMGPSTPYAPWAQPWAQPTAPVAAPSV